MRQVIAVCAHRLCAGGAARRSVAAVRRKRRETGLSKSAARAPRHVRTRHAHSFRPRTRAPQVADSAGHDAVEDAMTDVELRLGKPAPFTFGRVGPTHGAPPPPPTAWGAGRPAAHAGAPSAAGGTSSDTRLAEDAAGEDESGGDSAAAPPGDPVQAYVAEHMALTSTWGVMVGSVTDAATGGWCATCGACPRVSLPVLCVACRACGKERASHARPKPTPLHPATACRAHARARQHLRHRHGGGARREGRRRCVPAPVLGAPPTRALTAPPPPCVQR